VINSRNFPLSLKCL
jgi:hypothetical protein